MDLERWSGIGALGRPARRIDLEYPSGVLNTMSLAGAPEITPGTPGVDILLDALDGAVGLVYVTTGEPFTPEQTELLGSALGRTGRLALVVTADRAALEAKRAAADSRLDAATWYLAAECPSLRSDLRTWSGTAQLARALPRSRVGQIRAPAVPADNGQWQPVLREMVVAQHESTIRKLALECARITAGCLETLAREPDCSQLPDLLDRQLHGLSVRLTHRIETGTQAVADAVLASLLGADPDPEVRARFQKAIREAVESGEEPMPPHALMLTMTTGIARVVGRSALDSLTVLGLPVPNTAVLLPVAVAVNRGCYQLWQRRDLHGLSRFRAWLPRAVHRVEQVVGVGIDQRFRELEQAVETVAAEAVDHGFLLL